MGRPVRERAVARGVAPPSVILAPKRGVHQSQHVATLLRALAPGAALHQLREEHSCRAAEDAISARSFNRYVRSGLGAAWSWYSSTCFGMEVIQ